MISHVKMVITANPCLEATFGEVATSATASLDKVWRDGKIIESVSSEGYCIFCFIIYEKNRLDICLDLYYID